MWQTKNSHPQISLWAVRPALGRGLVGRRSETASSEPVPAASRGGRAVRQTLTGSVAQTDWSLFLDVSSQDWVCAGTVRFTMRSLVHSMLHHMMEAQALTTWLLLEMTTTGRVLAWRDTGEGNHLELQGVCVCVCIATLLHTLTSMVHSSPSCWKSVTNVIRWSSSVTPRRVWIRRNEQI